MASKTFLLQLRQRLNIPQVELAALFNTKRNYISQVECGARELTRSQLAVLKNLAVENWRRPGAKDKVLLSPDDHTKEELRKHSDDLRISLRHAQDKLEVLQKNFQAEAQALVWLNIMKEAVMKSDKPDKRILLWIEQQVAAKHVTMNKNGMAKQAVYAARISGIEAELRTIRNMLAKKKVVVKRMQVS